MKWNGDDRGTRMTEPIAPGKIKPELNRDQPYTLPFAKTIGN